MPHSSIDDRSTQARFRLLTLSHARGDLLLGCNCDVHGVSRAWFYIDLSPCNTSDSSMTIDCREPFPAAEHSIDARFWAGSLMQQPHFEPLANYQQTALMSVKHDERAVVREVPAVQSDWGTLIRPSIMALRMHSTSGHRGRVTR